jgi:hypothetical protein
MTVGSEGTGEDEEGGTVVFREKSRFPGHASIEKLRCRVALF